MPDNEFKSKLKALLTEYNASLGFDCSSCSDLHGIYDPEIVVYLGSKKVVLSEKYNCYPEDLK